MAKVSIPSIKTRFETGDRPTGEDYVDLIDTLAAQSTELGTAGNNDHVISGIENFTVIDSFNATEWRLVKYMVSVSKTSSGDNKFYATEFSILIDGTNINVAEYGVIDNDGNMGTVSVSRNGSTVSLDFTPLPTVRPVTVRFARVGLKA